MIIYLLFLGVLFGFFISFFFERIVFTEIIPYIDLSYILIFWKLQTVIYFLSYFQKSETATFGRIIWCCFRVFFYDRPWFAGIPLFSKPTHFVSVVCGR